MEIKKYREDIYAFEDEGVRSFLLLGRNQALIVDSGYGNYDLIKAARGITALPLIFVNTHSDVDHTGSNNAFEEIYVHEQELSLLKERRPDDSARYLTVSDGFLFDLGGISWKVIHCPGHTPGSISLFDEPGRTLLTGDTVSEEGIYLFGEARNHKDYRETLKKLITYDNLADTILPSHGTCPLTGLKELSQDLLAALDRYEQGEPEDEVRELWPGTTVKVYRFGRGCLFTEAV